MMWTSGWNCPSRSPHGERGLKLYDFVDGAFGRVSLSSWRAWIEICVVCFYGVSPFGRSPHGERGLK